MALAWKRTKVNGKANKADPTQGYIEVVIDPADAPYDYKLADRIGAVVFSDIEEAVKELGDKPIKKILEEGQRDVPVSFQLGYWTL